MSTATTAIAVPRNVGDIQRGVYTPPPPPGSVGKSGHAPCGFDLFCRRRASKHPFVPPPSIRRSLIACCHRRPTSPLRLGPSRSACQRRKPPVPSLRPVIVRGAAAADERTGRPAATISPLEGNDRAGLDTHGGSIRLGGWSIAPRPPPSTPNLDTDVAS